MEDIVTCDNPHCVDGFVETPYGEIYGNARCAICEANEEQEALASI